jgi:hypothetical protein
MDAGNTPVDIGISLATMYGDLQERVMSRHGDANTLLVLGLILKATKSWSQIKDPVGCFRNFRKANLWVCLAMVVRSKNDFQGSNKSPAPDY